MDRAHLHCIQVYYEDTDHSGVVYHANYLKFFERAREHFFGPENLVAMQNEAGLGFVVYQARLSYHRGAVFGERLRIETLGRCESEYRVLFQQRAIREKDDGLLVSAEIEMVLLNKKQQPVAFPPDLVQKIHGALQT